MLVLKGVREIGIKRMLQSFSEVVVFLGNFGEGNGLADDWHGVEERHALLVANGPEVF